MGGADKINRGGRHLCKAEDNNALMLMIQYNTNVGGYMVVIYTCMYASKDTALVTSHFPHLHAYTL